MENKGIRWLLLGPAMVVVIILAGIASAVLAPAMGLWFDPLAGASAAFLVVLTAFVIAPEKKFAVASFALAGGACLAWVVISPPSFFPENFGELAYQETNLPIVATLLAGVVAWLLCGVVALRSGRKAN